MSARIEPRAFSLAPDEWAHVDFTRRLRQRLESMGGGRVCELGGGARPALESEFLEANGLECLVVDISAPELEKAPDGYATLVGDVSSTSFSTGEHDGRYDIVFSRVLAEHVRDARTFHINVHRLLRPGGIAMHFFPTLWWPPFVVNRVLPESAAEWLLLKVEPWRVKSGDRGKFPAFYHWCFGPTHKQIGRFATAGFAVEHCVAYFGEQSHAPGRLLKKVDSAWTELMVRHPVYQFTSYATYTLRAQ
ncbi:MAG TPA: methyltransferase domain-containing protein [Solirubrobacteraceae bacterium]|jgi:SAM-dependent methyltransferase